MKEILIKITILDLAGVEIPQRYQGRSLTAFYGSTPGNWRSDIFCEHRLENNDLLPQIPLIYSKLVNDDKGSIDIIRGKMDVGKAFRNM
ncbi:MAG: hypothetical protein GY790_14580 [Bacteroidetes bacterium]|nr:hypothetical protein [Bacteroidota bacterium]